MMLCLFDLIAQGWGMTETNAVTVGIDGKDFKKRPSSCGKPTPLFDLKIVDEASRTRASACDHINVVP